VRMLGKSDSSEQEETGKYGRAQNHKPLRSVNGAATRLQSCKGDAELTISSLAFSETAWRIFRFPSQRNESTLGPQLQTLVPLRGELGSGLDGGGY